MVQQWHDYVRWWACNTKTEWLTVFEWQAVGINLHFRSSAKMAATPPWFVLPISDDEWVRWNTQPARARALYITTVTTRLRIRISKKMFSASVWSHWLYQPAWQNETDDSISSAVQSKRTFIQHSSLCRGGPLRRRLNDDQRFCPRWNFNTDIEDADRGKSMQCLIDGTHTTHHLTLWTSNYFLPNSFRCQINF